MTWWQAIILGIVEGVTEYLPVSSTGHLLLTQRLLGMSKTPAADAYAVMIQFGAILAVLGLYARRVRQMGRGLIGRDRTGFKLLVNVTAAFTPAAAVGLLFDKRIEKHLFGLWPVATAWIVGGLAVLALVAWRRGRSSVARGRDIDQLDWSLALMIGWMQCLALWPGVSRSLVTIVGGLMVGLSMAAALEFSFLLGVATLSAAGLYKAMKINAAQVDELGGWWMMLLGVVVATLAAAISVKWMIGYLRKHSLAVFGWWRIGLGLVVALLLLAGAIKST